MRLNGGHFRSVALRVVEIMLLSLKHVIMFFVPKYLRFKDVKDEIALVTGGGSGLGRLLAIELARRNAVVILFDVNHAGMEETKKLIKQDGGEVHTYICDVSNREQVYQSAQRVKHQIGVVTILVNNAGVLFGDDFLDIPDDKIVKTMEINTLGPMFMCKAFLPDMLESNYGHIVNVASMGGLLAFPKLTDYGASKHAVVGFDGSLKIELFLNGYTGVHTTLACPTFFNSGLYKGFRQSLLARELSVDYVCQEIIAAVLTDQEEVLIPSVGRIMTLFRQIIPVDIGIRVAHLIGMYSTMKNFKGSREMALNRLDILARNNNVIEPVGKIAVE